MSTTDASRPSFGTRMGRALRRHWLLAILSVPLLAVAVAIGLVAMWVASLVPLTPDIATLQKAKDEHPATVLSADGKELAVFRRTNREWIKLDDMAPSLVPALLATEDHRFWEHRGLDWRRTLAAAWNTLQGRTQGGSTLTQQLARNVYPEEIGRDATLTRKVKEAITAVKIEQAYSKEDILETYLNTVPFLYNAYGIEAAARTYFDKPARELNVLESATLVGMLKGTRYYNPVLNPERARQRRNVVLAQMARHGHLPEAELAQLRERPLALDFTRQQEPPGPAPHFAQALRRWLIDWADAHGYNMYADGLVVRTTIDSRLQAAATQAVTRQADRLQQLADKGWGTRGNWGAPRELLEVFVRESDAFKAAVKAGEPERDALRRLLADQGFLQALREDKMRLQAGFMAMEPGTGYVRAWVGSRDFATDQFDHVQQARRQPGSTFKPFVYGVAFADGTRTNETLMDVIVEHRTPDGKLWAPRDLGEPSHMPMTLRDGLALSKNTITAQLVYSVGPQRVAQLARAMGVRESRLEEWPAIALGTSPVTLKEMVAAYGTIANNGNYVEPAIVTRVEDRQGRVLQEFAPAAAEPALAPEANLVLLDVMRGVIDRGTGAGLRGRHGLQQLDLAGKTGTTQDNTDGWFVMFHPQLVAGAWVGFNDSRITMHDSWGQGARSALPMVGDFFQQSLKLKVIDAKARFGTPPPEPQPLPPAMPPAPEGAATDPYAGQAPEWWRRIFPQAPAASPAAAPPRTEAPDLAQTPPPARAPERAIVVAPPRPPAGEAVIVSPVPAPTPLPPAVLGGPPAGVPVQRAIVIAPPRGAQPQD